MSAGTGRWPAVRRGSAQVLVWYLRLVALVCFIGGLRAPFRQRVDHANSGELFTPFLVSAGFASAAFAAFLAMVLRRRKRAAWIFTAVLLNLFVLAMAVFMATDDVVKHPFNWVSTGITTVVWIALWTARGEFRTKGDPANIRRAIVTGILGALVFTGLGWLLVGATNKEHDAPIGKEIGYVLLRATSLSGNGAGEVIVPRWVDIVINVLALALFFLVLHTLFSAPRNKAFQSDEDEQRLRALLARFGERDSLGYFALRRDKSVIWSPSGKAAITHRVVGGVTLASGDPIGDPEAWPGAIEQWLAEARQHGWVPAVMGAGEEAGTVFGRFGLDALELGDEAIVCTADFTLEGRAMRTVRQAYNRVQRAGYSTRVRRHEDIPPDELAALTDLSDDWRDGSIERGFSMALGRLGESADGRCVMVECLDGEGRHRAMLSFVPWGEKGLSLDLMRRDRDSDNGLIEYMILDVIQRAKDPATEADLRIERLSLNFAMFRSVFERGSKIGAGPILRLEHAMLRFLSRWWQIESLYRANAKYRPDWEPRFILFEFSRDLPRIGVASARAEGFIAAPRPLAWLRRKVKTKRGGRRGPSRPTATSHGVTPTL